MPLSRWITLLTLIWVLALGACGSDRARGPDGQLGTTLDALCEARMLASRGLIRDAEAEFQDRAHAYLHELARETSETDRQAAARLLETKQLVEQAFADPPEPRAVAALLGDLRDRTAEAAGISAPACG
jgi:hypothetical protein